MIDRQNSLCSGGFAPQGGRMGWEVERKPSSALNMVSSTLWQSSWKSFSHTVDSRCYWGQFLLVQALEFREFWEIFEFHYEINMAGCSCEGHCKFKVKTDSEKGATWWRLAPVHHLDGITKPDVVKPIIHHTPCLFFSLGHVIKHCFRFYRMQSLRGSARWGWNERSNGSWKKAILDPKFAAQFLLSSSEESKKLPGMEEFRPN